MAIINLIELLFRKFGWSSCSQIKFNPNGSLLLVTGVCKIIRMNDVEIGEGIVYQVRGANVGDIRSRISLRPMETQAGHYFFQISLATISNHQNI